MRSVGAALVALVTVLVVIFTASRTYANPGIAGYSGVDPDKKCKACHASGPTPALKLTGPLTIPADTSTEYVLQITAAPPSNVGYSTDIAAVGATLANVSANTKLTFGELVSVAGNSNNTFRFSVKAPVAGIATLYIAGMGSNGTGTSGDSTTNSVVQIVVGEKAGRACVDDTKCGSGRCAGGVCCAEATCNGPCKACAPDTGACNVVTNADDPSKDFGCDGDMTCDATGACKLKNGQSCSAGAATCASGLCSENVCCDKACTAGSCDRCDRVGAVGTCGPAPKRDPGIGPACSNDFACDGKSATCTTCTSDDGCAASFFCASDSTCKPRKTDGATCNPSVACKTPGCAECQSGYCVDGVCCNAACDSECQACAANLKESGDASGVCGSSRSNEPTPRKSCANEVTTDKPCAKDGLCDGKGRCRDFAPHTKACGVTTCDATTNRVVGSLCTGLDATCSDTSSDCSTFKCIGSTCAEKCTSNDECSATGYCNAGKCLARSANGKTCSKNDECLDGFCVDGVCCNSACSQQCEACNTKDAEGTCTPVTGAPHGARPACPAGDATAPCSAAQCDGSERTTCEGFVGAQVACGAATCANGVEKRASVCDGEGGCKAFAPVQCSAYACGATACNTTCASNADCADGNTCDPATNKCVSAATCDGDHTTTSPNGTTVDCSPFKCSSDGTCRRDCASVDDCVAPLVCDATKQCVSSPTTTPDAGGCQVGSSSGPSGVILTVLAALAIRRRRRSELRSPST